jgi:DNA-binding CsgD family transcriptional regulator
MTRIWISGFALVTAIATLKTYLVLSFAMPGMADSLPTISGLFALFFGLTAAVAYVSFTQLRAYLERQRKEKLIPGASEPIAKETVILRYARDWGLSQAEADVAIFVAKGFSNSEIAEMRGSAIATVKSQLGRIYHKSGLDTRYQLIGFVTDEVCGMANEPEKQQVQVVTRNVLPLSGRTQTAA